MEERMHRDENVIGRNVAKFRYQRGWTQDELVGKLQLLGCYMTRDILANIETQRCPATDKQIEFFAEVFGVNVGDLFPGKRNFSGRIVGLEMEIPTRRPCLNRRPRSHAHLAEPARK
jgi:transcriptional regulator with XRE-family HTH domain